MNKSKIEWCDMTWNPVTGCLHGCEYCYARKIARRFEGNCYGDIGIDATTYSENPMLHALEKPTARINKDGRWTAALYPFGFAPTFHRYRLDEPAKLKKSQNIFVCSMADLFGDWVPGEWIAEVFKACEAASWHRYLFLTKNPKRYGILNGLDHRYDWEWAKDNYWFGITVSNAEDLSRLRNLPYGKANTFLSIEPIQSEIDLSFYLPDESTKWKCSFCGFHAKAYSSHCSHCGKQGGYSGSFRNKPINWIIVGAETGNRKDKIIPKREWIENIAAQCRAAGIPVFMKNSIIPIVGEESMIREFPWEA